MRQWIRHALTRRVSVKGSRKGTIREIEVEPSKRLVYAMELVITMFLSLTALEIVHIVFLGSWNSEIFAAISGLVGTIIGVFFGKKG